jgi:diguanylate cyclase (GGDEF)-like protein
MNVKTTSTLQYGIFAFLIACAIYGLVLLVRPGGDEGTAWFDIIGAALIAGSAGFWCVTDILWGKSADAKSPRRSVSLYLGLSAVLFAVGAAIRANYELLLRHTPSALSWSDAGQLVAYPILLIALLRMPVRPLFGAARGQVIFDTAMTMTALATASWCYLLAPVFANNTMGAVDKLAGISHPVWDLALVFALLIVSEHAQDPRLRRSVVLASFGLGAIVVGDTFYSYAISHGGYQTGLLSDAGWPLGFGLLAIAGLIVRRDVTDEYAASTHIHVGQSGGAAQAAAEAPAEPVSLAPRSFIPYALAPVVLALTVSVLLGHHGRVVSIGVYLGCAALVGMILVRQIITILDVNNLRNDLRESYKNLQAVHEALETKSKSLTAATTRLDGLAAMDAMTGVANHRKFQERLREDIHNSFVGGTPCSMLMIDIDQFKSYNDTFGHPSGDEVLKIVARLTREAVRPSDLAARYGGEEFAVLLPGADARIAMQVAERIRQRIERYDFPYRKITISIGVSGIAGGVDIGPEFWIEDTESALCRAKYGGRNNTVFSQVFEPAQKGKKPR